MILLKLGFLFSFYLSTCTAEDKKWVWGDNSRSNNGRSGGLRYEESRDPRYEVYENGNDDQQGPFRPIQFNNRPQYPRPGLNRPFPPGPGLNRPFPPGPGLNRPFPPGPGLNRPFPPGPGINNNGPTFSNPELVGNNRPGGLYGNVGPINGIYGQGGRPIGRPEYYPDDPRDPGILTGPIPSWVQEKPFKNFDTCRCTERFNCRSPGLSYGQCDVGKKYCCYNRNKFEDLGSDFPSRPIHSPENGILVGPGGPGGGPVRPGFGRPGPLVNRPIGYGADNGILLGPTGRSNDKRSSD